MKNKLTISEVFSSIQGEGVSTGIPSVFVRLTGCNLTCGGKGARKDFKQHGAAEWVCDSIKVWQTGNSTTAEDFLVHLAFKYDILYNLRNGWRLIFTGGEPLLQAREIHFLLELLSFEYTKKYGEPLPWEQIEFETNGTVYNDIVLSFLTRGCQFNVSPKLTNSGESAFKRYKADVIGHIASYQNTWFKFVTTGKDHEIYEIESYGLKSQKIILMPAADNQNDLQELSVAIARICILRGYKFSTRLQIVLWNQTTGV
jgi:7-carboxy-7-deazaguanine synthase